MPVSVLVPGKIRIDREAAVDQPEWIQEAASRAFRRALAKSRKQVLDRRGGYMGVVAHRPQFTWSGADADRVSTLTRRNIEQRLEQAIRDATEAAGIYDWSDEASNAPPVMPAEIFERKDMSRSNEQLNYYSIPSYDDPPAVEVIDFEDELVEVESPNVFEWRPISEEDMLAHMRENILEMRRQWGTPRAGVARGFIFQRPGGDFVVVIDTSPRSFFSFAGFGRYEYRPGQTPAFQQVSAPVTPALATAVRVMLPGGDRAGLIAALDAEFGNMVQGQIEQGNPRAEGVLPDEYNGQVARAVTREIEARADALLTQLNGTAPTSIVKVEMGGAFVLLVGTAAVDTNLHWIGSANLLPFTRVVPRRGSGSDGDGQGRSGDNQGGGGQNQGEGQGPEGQGQGRGPSGDGTGDGTGTGGSSASRGIVYAPSDVCEEPQEGGALFPSFGLSSGSLECEPFEGELKLYDLGTAGTGISVMVNDIAARLDIGDPCVYPAMFCYHAARTIESRAAGISSYIAVLEPEGFTLPVPEGTGNMGAIDFRPVASPAIQFMRHLAGVVSRVHGLMQLILRTYEQSPQRESLLANGSSSIASWQLHFLEMLTPAMEDAVGKIFEVTCQAMLIQLLQVSKRGIDGRIQRFQQYAPIFERLMQSQLTEYAELTRLRDRLQWHERATAVQALTNAAGGDVTSTVAATSPATAWFSAARGLSSVFLEAQSAGVDPGGAGEFVTVNGITKVRDAHGTLWSMQELEQAMVTQRGMAEGIDPLVKQIADIPDVLERFRTNRNAIRNELWSVLHEMSSNNTEMLDKARNDPRFAFKASSISDDIPNATISGGRYNLQGIHLRAHEQIGMFFQGSSYYAMGVDSLMSAQLGKEALTGFGLMVGIVILCVLCPPLGFAVGVVVAGVEVAHARERERLFESMLDPELVLTRAEVEAGLFAAYLGLALSLIPEAGTVVGAIGRGGKVALRAGLRAGARSAGRYVVRRATQQMMQAAARDLLQAFVTELMTNIVMEKVIQKVMEPILAAIEREVMIEQSVGGPEGARFILAVLDSERRP